MRQNMVKEYYLTLQYILKFAILFSWIDSTKFGKNNEELWNLILFQHFYIFKKFLHSLAYNSIWHIEF